MEIWISKSDLATLMRGIDKCVAIIKAKEPTTREYNAARMLMNVKRAIMRKNKL
jgi:hypothetical protein